MGPTSQTVSPPLDIACGISSAVPHQADMSSARIIVANTSNPETPIFTLPTYETVEDLFEIVPVLTEQATQLKRGGCGQGDGPAAARNR